ncbi:hypothetical protein NG42_21620, partial [Winslowiella iniecta]
ASGCSARPPSAAPASGRSLFPHPARRGGAEFYACAAPRRFAPGQAAKTVILLTRTFQPAQ